MWGVGSGGGTGRRLRGDSGLDWGWIGVGLDECSFLCLCDRSVAECSFLIGMAAG
jgi:hypothetical protein